MTKKNLIVLASLLMVTSISVGGGLLKSKKAEQVRAEENSPWTIADNSFEAGFFEQYNGGVKNGYQDDKPLHESKNALGGHLWGSYENGLQKNYNGKELYSGIVDAPLKWNFSGIRSTRDWENTGNLADGGLTYARLENNSSDANMYNFAEADFPDEYAISHLLYDGTTINRVGGMVSTTAIPNIQDISFYWRTSYTRRAYICYQITGETEWKVYRTITCDDNLHLVGNYTGTRGWDAHGFTTFNTSTWNEHELKGSTAKLAIVIGGKESGNLPISGICINTNNAAIRYLNTLSYKDGVCSTSQFDLNLGSSSYRHNQDLFQLVTEHADPTILENYIVVGGHTSEYYALGLYNHLVTSIPALGSVKTSSARFYNPLGNNKNSSAIMVVTILSVVSVSSIILLVVSKKKKRVL